MRKFLLAATCMMPLAFAAQAQTPTTMPGKSTPAPSMASPDVAKSAPVGAVPVIVKATAADTRFVEKAAQGGMTEVQAAKLAQQTSQDDNVKAFAQHMLDDHGPNNDQLTKLAQDKGITVPDSIGPMHEKEMASLQGLTGKKFDQAYMKGQIKGHTAMLKLMQGEAKKGSDADLKAFAEQTAPVVQKHLDMAKSKAAM